jgi:hypothetical protein
MATKWNKHRAFDACVCPCNEADIFRLGENKKNPPICGGFFLRVLSNLAVFVALPSARRLVSVLVEMA